MTFEVREGEVLSLIGPNGAGKTSAFNAITGYICRRRRRDRLPRRATERSEAQRDRRAGRGAHVPEDQRVRRPDRAREHADRPAPALAAEAARDHPRPAVGGARGAAARAQAARDPALRRARGARATQVAASLPYGEQRLLEVAVALAARPKLLLLDEPVSGMNPVETASFMRRSAHPRARHHRAAGRARHEDGDGRVRPHRVPEPGPHHRQRHARPRSSATPR